MNDTEIHTSDPNALAVEKDINRDLANSLCTGYEGEGLKGIRLLY